MIFLHCLILACTLIVEIGTNNYSDNSQVSLEAGGKYYVTELRNSDHILCRGCGSDVSSADFLISKLSPTSYYVFNDTLFKKEEVLVQLVSHDIIFQFPVLTTTQSTCQGIGKDDMDKTKIMSNADVELTPITLAGFALEVVDNYLYLGQCIQLGKSNFEKG